MVPSFKGRMIKKSSDIKSLVPFLFTFANVAFGFFSIIKTIEGNFIAAALCIMFAAVMDACDGRVARYLGTAGELGSELDSLCDAVSFCLAPTILLYSWYLHGFGHAGLFVSALVLYLCAGLLRLARFNLSEVDQQVFFLGLPTTIAAFFFAQLVLYQELVAESSLTYFLNEKVLVGLVASMAFLMLSSLRFPAFKKMPLPVKKSVVAVKIALMLGVTLWCLFYEYYFVVLAMVSIYIGASVIFNGLYKAKKVLKKRH